MALINCPECRKEISDTSKNCIHCGYVLKHNKMNLKTRKVLAISSLIVVVVLFIVAMLVYFVFPNTPEWLCKHSKTVATCTEPEVCNRCGKYFSAPLGHTMMDSTCTESSICSVCGYVEGEPLGHCFKEATCTLARTCSVCGEIEGEPLGHSYIEATCESAKYCSVCRHAEGTELGHNYVDYICTKCGITSITSSDIPNVLDITDLYYSINYYDGIEWTIAFTNKSNKTINYIYLTFYYCNTVGDILINKYSGDIFDYLEYVGPLTPNTSSGLVRFDADFYNSTFDEKFIGNVYFDNIRIVYSDGTELNISPWWLANEVVVAWRD